MKKKELTALLLSILIFSGCAAYPNLGDTPQTGGSAQSDPPAQSQPEQDSGTPDTPDTPELDGVTICLDPGHGITDKHAQERVSPKSDETKSAYVSGAEGAEQTEEQVNLAVARKAKQKLEALGAQVVLTRTTHEATVSNIERARIANDAQADLCVRIHADGSENSDVHGVGVLVPSGELLGTPDIKEPSREAGQLVLEQVVACTGAKDRGLTEREDLTGFNWSEVPCILLEMGFLSNKEEDLVLKTDSYREMIAQGLTDGIRMWVEKKRESL